MQLSDNQRNFLSFSLTLVARLTMFRPHIIVALCKNNFFFICIYIHHRAVDLKFQI